MNIVENLCHHKDFALEFHWERFTNLLITKSYRRQLWEIGKLSSICFIIWQLPSSIIIFSGSKERSQGRLKSPCKSSKEERRWRRRKGQKEEVVQGKNPRQIEQLGLVRQAYLRQTVERSSNLQTYHTFDCEWKIKGPWILGPQGFARTCPER